MKITSIVRTETSAPWLNMFHAQYEHRGKNGNWYFVSRNSEISIEKPSESIGVFVVPFHIKENKLVVIKEFRIPLRAYEYSFPAGLIDKGESPTEAAIREVQEETGFTVTKVNLVGPASYSSAGLSDECLNIIFVECEGVPNTNKNGDSEDIQVLLMGEKEVDELLKKDDVLFSAKFWCIARNFFNEIKIKRLQEKIEETLQKNKLT